MAACSASTVYRIFSSVLLIRPADQYLTVQLLLPVCGGELAELVDQDLGFARRDEFAGVDGIDEQLELGKLKRCLGHIVAAAAPALLHDLIFGVGQVV